MPKKKEKILLLLAGGTCLIDKNGHIFSVREKSDIHTWLKGMPELNILADIDTVLISGEDDIVSVDTWQQVAGIIDKNLLEADAFVVVTKIDKIIETALALNFLLQNLQKNIIITGSQVSGSAYLDKKERITQLHDKQGGLGLRTNLINAFQASQQALPGVAIMFGTRLIAATKAVYRYDSPINPLASLDNNYWGRVDFGVNIQSGLKHNNYPAEIYKNLSSRILVIDDWPGIAWHWSKNDLANYQAIFIKTSPYQPLESAKQKQIINWGLSTVLYNYQAVPPVKGTVAISGCTLEAAIIKTMWAVANLKQLGDFNSAMQQNIIGEFYSVK